MQSFLYDLRYAFRTLRKNPVLTSVALASLAIGIGANTAIFTLMDRVLLRSLPVRNPEQLVLLRSRGGWSGFVETSYGDGVSLSWPKYRMLRDRSAGIFDGLLARFPFRAGIATQGQSENVDGELISGNYFDVLGVRPALGRLLTGDDARTSGANPVAILSHAYWVRRFGSNPAVLNQTVAVNGRQLTIVGVAQAGFRSVGAGEAPSLFVPITMHAQLIPGFPDLSENAHAYWINIFGRLKPGESPAQAEAAVAVVWHGIVAEDVKSISERATAAFRAKYVARKLDLVPAATGISSFRDGFSTPLYLLMGMVGFVLLIACANVANLLLARAATREKEIAIRISLGAGWARLMRHAFVESVMLSLGGGIAGIFVSWWAGSLMLRLMPDSLPLAGVTSDPDGRVLTFTLAVSLLTGLLFGCVPALRSARPNIATALKEQTANLSSGGHARFRKALVVCQIALSVLLLASAGVFAHSLFNLRNLNPGFRSDHLVTFSVNPALNGYKGERSIRVLEDIQRALPTVAGISQASMAKLPLLTGTSDIGAYDIEGFHPTDGKNPSLHRNRIGTGFFSLMGIPLLAGREFREGDVKGATLVGIVNESLVHRYFEGRNPIGLHIISGRKKTVNIEIVGIVKDAKYDGLREDPIPFLYLAAAQDDDPSMMNYYARTQMSTESVATPLRQMIQRVDANLPMEGPKSMRELIMESVFAERMVAALSLTFAGLATVLAAVGLYGVIAWAVTRRKREIGIRMAMGAHSSDIMRMILLEVLWLGLAGIVIAAPLWVAAARLLESQLYGVTSRDPWTLAASIAILSMVAAAAGFVPAFRAARVQPISAIRD